MKKPVIAIDGFSSTGKSSISKAIAKKLGLIHIDTGALYRAVTLLGLQKCCTEADEINFEKLISLLPETSLEFKTSDGQLLLFLNNENVETAIRDPKISEHVSAVAKMAEVRNFLLQMQRDLATKGGVIMDGRDIGTVVLPDADYKFFLTASIDERTKRRFYELQGQGVQTEMELVKNNLQKRDKIDSEREIAPLKMGEDAILIDNSKLTKEETAELLISKIM